MPKSIDPGIQKKIEQWLSGPYDENTKSKIQKALKEDPESLIDAFYTDLSFGTGGMRGLMGVGTNRMNRYTIHNATQGLANYLDKAAPGNSHKILISHDNRKNSRHFAEEAAKVLLGNQIEVLLSPELRPTPYVSFACRHHRCSGAIMITASHNPKEYNGYKVYWSDGAQVVPPHDKGIIKEVQNITSPKQVKLAKLEGRLFHILGEETDEAYLEAIKQLQNYPDEHGSYGEELKVVYTPLHGAGITLLPRAFSRWGFQNLHLEEKQKDPDENFSFAPVPNPEDPKALERGVQKLQEIQGDLLLATDPDADRVGAVIMHQGKPVYLNGNEMASILLYHICRSLKDRGHLPDNGACVTTIVTTELLSQICRSYNLAYFEVLTGFKYIGEKIRQWEESIPSPYSFLFGAEESYGYLYGSYARDKDGISASCLIAEAALHAKRNGQTLLDLLHQIYEEYGIFQEKQFSKHFSEGKEGHKKMKDIMQKLRESPPKKIAEKHIIEFSDYLSGKKIDLQTAQEMPIDLPKSDVLAFRLEDHSKFVIRPSGTEPKIKVYGLVRHRRDHNMKKAIEHAKERLDHMLSYIKDHFFGDETH